MRYWDKKKTLEMSKIICNFCMDVIFHIVVFICYYVHPYTTIASFFEYKKLD